MSARRISLLGLFLLTMVCGGPRVCADDKKPAPSAPSLKVHPKIFSMFQGWLSDGESPVVTEVNLDAVEGSRNQFDPESVKLEEGWIRCPRPDGGFMRYRVMESKGSRFTVEYQENGGGSLTTTATFEVSLEKREIRQDGKPATIRVLRVISYRAK